MPALVFIVKGTSIEAENGELVRRVRRLAKQDRLVAIAHAAEADNVYVLLTPAPSVN